MEKIRLIWYRIVARPLLKQIEQMNEDLDAAAEEINRQQARYALMLDTSMKANTTISELQEERRQLRDRVRSLERQDPLGRSIDTASSHASRQRIMDLEGQLRKNGIDPQ